MEGGIEGWTGLGWKVRRGVWEVATIGVSINYVKPT